MATMALSLVATDSWKADLYGSTSAAYRTRDWINHGRNLLQIWHSLGKLNGILENFFNGLYRLIEDAQRGPIPAPPDDVPPMNYKEALDHLWRLHSTLDYLCKLAARKGLRKKSLIKNRLAALEAHREQVLDAIQWMDESLDSNRIQYVEEVCTAALEELERGETITVG